MSYILTGSVYLWVNLCKQMKLNIRFILVAWIAGILFSCGESVIQKPVKPSEPFSIAEWFARDSVGIFRGAEFGDEQEVILQMESDTFLTFRSEKILEYDYPIPLPGMRHYSLKYSFKKNGLHSFVFDAFLGTEEEGEKLYTELLQYFEKKFGEYVIQMGSSVWKLSPGEKYKEAYLELKDESAEFGYGKVNMTAYAVK